MTNTQNDRSGFNDHSSQKNKTFKPYQTKTSDTKQDLKAPVIFGRDMSNEAARTPWPRFGRIADEALLQTTAFEESLHADYENGIDVFIYMAGCSGLQAKAKGYKLPLFKCGVTQVPDLLVRQRDLNSDAYGSVSMKNGQPVFESDWTNWEMRQAELLSPPDAASPVRLMKRGLGVRLPAGLTPIYFEKELHRRLYPCALHIFATSKAGRKHFELLDIDPTSVPRFISYGFGEGSRLSLAHEIYICRPREDWTRLRLLAEAIVSQFLAKASA